MSEFTFSWNHEEETQEDLRIHSVRIRRASQKDDELSYVRQAEVDAEALWSFGQEVTVRRDGEIIFVGYAQPEEISGGPDDESRSGSLMGMWWKLGRTQFLSPAPGVDNPTSEEFTTRRQLFVSATGGEMTSREMLTEVLLYAKTKGVILDYSGVEQIEDGIYPAAEESVDRSLAEVIQSCLRYHLDCVVAFTGRLLVIRRRGVTRSTWAVGTAPFTALDLQVRHDLAPSGVYIRFEQKGAVQTTSGYKEAVYLDWWPGTAHIGDEGVVMETMQLEAGDSVPAGLPRRYMEMWTNPPVVEGTLTFEGAECDTGLLPGHTINVTGAAEEFRRMDAFIQSVDENHERGLTKITVGLPSHLGLRQFLDVIRLKRQRVKDNELGDPPGGVEVPTSPLTCYIDMVERLPVLRVTSGEVSDGENSRVPTWEFSSTPLSSLPYALLERGASFDVYLFVEFKPDATQFVVQDELGNSSVEWLGIGVGEITAARIVFSVTNARAPEVDPENGDVTSGRYYFRLASVTWPLAAAMPTVTLVRTGNLQFLHVPPARLFILPES